MDEEVVFRVFGGGIGYCAMDSNGNSGFGATPAEAIADLQLAYDSADFDVLDLVFTED